MFEITYNDSHKLQSFVDCRKAYKDAKIIMTFGMMNDKFHETFQNMVNQFENPNIFNNIIKNNK
jgi:hypothetical protein